MESIPRLLDADLNTTPTGLLPKTSQDPLALANYNTCSSASSAEFEPLSASPSTDTSLLADRWMLSPSSGSELIDSYDWQRLDQGQMPDPYAVAYDDPLAAAASVLSQSPLALPPPPPGSFDPGDTLDTAENWGQLNDRTVNLSRTIGGEGDSNDFFRFSVEDRNNLSVRLSNLNADADVDLIWDRNTNGQIDSGETITYSVNPGSSADSFNLILGSDDYPSGTYFIRVYPGVPNANTGYALTFSGTELSATIRPESDPVNIWRYDTGGRTERDGGSSQGIDPDRETVVVIHGWQNSDQSPQVRELAKEASEFDTVQVLAVDWGSIAQAGLDSVFGIPYRPPFNTAGWVAPVARWVHDRLVTLGIDSDQLTFVGHSLGTYVSSETARLFDNLEDDVDDRVKTLVALDPAYPANRYDLDNTRLGRQRPADFEDVAQYSLAFVTANLPLIPPFSIPVGLAGDNDKAATADDSLILRFPGFPFFVPGIGPLTVHRGVVDVFTDALDRGLLTLPNLTLPDHENDWYSDNGFLIPFENHEGRIRVAATGNDRDWSNGENPWRIAELARVVSTNIFGFPNQETTWT